MGLDNSKLEPRCPGVSGMFTHSLPTYGKVPLPTEVSPMNR